ncbi:MAG: hypothetical protein D6760_03175, partial [Deltaproteobacteria bacterium]
MRRLGGILICAIAILALIVLAQSRRASVEHARALAAQRAAEEARARAENLLVEREATRRELEREIRHRRELEREIERARRAMPSARPTDLV